MTLSFSLCWYEADIYQSEIVKWHANLYHRTDSTAFTSALHCHVLRVTNHKTTDESVGFRMKPCITTS